MYAELWFTNNFVLHVKRSKISEKFEYLQRNWSLNWTLGQRRKITLSLLKITMTSISPFISKLQRRTFANFDKKDKIPAHIKKMPDSPQITKWLLNWTSWSRYSEAFSNQVSRKKLYFICSLLYIYYTQVLWWWCITLNC